MERQNLERRVVYRGRKIDLALQAVVLPDGSIAQREVVVHRGAVALVPMVDADHVCLVENQRYAVARSCWKSPPGRSIPASPPSRPPRASWPRRPATAPGGSSGSANGSSRPG